MLDYLKGVRTMKKWLSFSMISLIFLLLFLPSAFAMQEHEKNNKPESASQYKVPSSVLNITKENTYPNPVQDMPLLQPSELTQQLN
jgi:YfkD-like protein